jgi:hypothetical protein
MMALLVAAPSPEGGWGWGGGGVSRGGLAGGRATGTAGPGSKGFGLAWLGAAGPRELGPNGFSGAGHKWGRAGTNDSIGKATNDSNGEAEKAKKKGETETTSADNTIAQRKEVNRRENSSADGRSDDISNGSASTAGRDKEIGGGGIGGGSNLVQLGLRANGHLLCLSRRSALT